MYFAKKYEPGTIHMDLPTSYYIYELPLLSFSDIHGAVNLSLIFNYRMKEEQGNPFRIASGYKLNLQKRLIMENSIPKALQEEDGKTTSLIRSNNIYVLDNDDHRILRRSNNYYKLENMDYSSEVYDETGKIICTYDKYNNLILSYDYTDSNLLASITYRNSKVIHFGHLSNRLASISYANCSTALTYAQDRIFVTHYSGVKYTLTTASGPCDICGSSCMDFFAVAENPSNTNIAPCSVALRKIASNQIRITYKNNGETIDAATYAFFGSPDSTSPNYQFVEITSNTGVTTRLQYQGRDLCCSYEISNGDAAFTSDKYNGSVQIHKAMNEEDTPHVSGTLGVNNSAFTFAISDARRETYIPTDIANAGTGYYVLTGWIRSKEDAENSNDNALIITNVVGEQPITLNPTLAPDNKWSFFAYKFYLPGTWISIYGNPNNIELKDVRMAFYSTALPDGQYASSVGVTEDILIAHSGTAEVVLPLADCTFKIGPYNISTQCTVSFDDLLKYKLNQRKNRNIYEFYCNNGKMAFSTSSMGSVTIVCNGNTYSLSDCKLGRRTYSRKGIDLEKIVDNSDDYFLIHYALKADGSVGSYQVMDNNLDVICTNVDNIITNYTRNQDLITAESVPNLYTRTTTYSTDSDGNPVLIATDEFGKATTYTLDKTWGGVKKVLLPDGSAITDTYDDDMCTLMERSFGSTSGRCIEYSITNGKLDGMRSGYLEYFFNYDSRDRLISTDKYYTRVEEHIYNDDNTNIQSYYPSQSNPMHSVAATFNTYGKLTSIAGALINTYDTWPEFDPNTGELKAQRRGRNAFLARSIDTIQGKASRYTYDPDSGLLAKKEVTDNTNYATKFSTETFAYDKLGRIITDDCTYRVSDKVTSQVTYATAVNNPNADNRVRKYTYKNNGYDAAVTTTSYDTFKRILEKAYKVGGQTFRRTFTYQNTRLSYAADSAGDHVSLTYDDCGRIRLMMAAGKVAKYYYDQYGQLIREDNQALAKSFVYEYNYNGCLTAVKTYDYTPNTLSGTPVTTALDYIDDQLTDFDGTAIAYNAMGCPTTYDGMSANWTRGKLSRLSGGSSATGTKVYSFNYNAFGQRTSKTYSFAEGSNPIYAGKLIGSNKRFYYDHSGRLIAEYTTKEYHETGFEDEKIVFLYDGNTIVGMALTLNDVTTYYYFYRNPLGDVVGIYNTSGTLVARYIYDAWGNCTISGETTDITVAQANPIRYRGYYYDEDTGLYYCNARYYSPKWRRFISPDDTAYLDPYSVNGLNQYCYCNNDPINYADPSGHSALLISVIIGAVLGGIYGGVSAAVNGQNVLGGIFVGALVGGLTSLCIETLALPYMLLGTFGAGFGGDLLSQWLLDGKSVEDWNLTSAAWAGLTNMSLAVIGKGLSKIGSATNLRGLTNILFGTITNSPLMGMGMALNLFGSRQLPEYTVGNMVESVVQSIYALIWGKTGNNNQPSPYQWSPLITQSGQIMV